MADKEIDAVSGVETTGHSWDGIKELNNPLPRWWVWTFYATVIFSVGCYIGQKQQARHHERQLEKAEKAYQDLMSDTADR